MTGFDLERLRDEVEKQRGGWVNRCAEVGDFTYACAPRIWTWGQDAKLYIGKFCSIGANVQFLLGGEHHTEWCSTYPFNVMLPGLNEERHAKTKGDIWIGNDVWIGNDAKIMSGVNIFDGAVIAGSAVVTQDVLAYEVVGGVPAKHIKLRMGLRGINQLMKLTWWDWPLDKLAEALPLLCSDDWEGLMRFHEEWERDHHE
jgi:acetyltransferase-like isoleucine patch superfamily enzyme